MEENLHQSKLEETHASAFAKVCEVVDREILSSQKIVKLSELCEMYISVLDGTEFANRAYRSQKLKAKLEKCDKYKGRLCFSRAREFQSYLVYDGQAPVDHVVSQAYELGAKDLTKEVASYLRKAILDGFKNSEAMPWPPTDVFLRKSDCIPSELNTFLSYVLSGKADSQSERVQRLVSSIGQDVCRAATSGQWVQPKHVLVCMTLRHLFRSKDLITLMNKLGHSEGYPFSLELETAIAKALQEVSNLLPTQIVLNPTTPSVFHSEFDNFDQVLNVLQGPSSVHTAHGIMLQEVQGEDHGGTFHTLPSVERSGEQSLPVTEEELAECFITQRKSPGFEIRHWITEGGDAAVKTAQRSNLLWVLLRKHSSISGQEVPGWAGFVSQKGDVPEKKTTLGYYPVINHPITEYKTVQECLRYAEEATREVGQDYIISTYDLGVCMKAFPIMWNWPDRYSKHIVLIGSFHLVCAYFRMMGKKLDGSGFSDILLEAGLTTSGSVQGIISGKHYDRALFCHRTMMECLERLLLERYLEVKGETASLPTLSEESERKIESVINSFEKEEWASLQQDAGLSDFMDDYKGFRRSVREGALGPTAQFWMSFLDHVGLVLVHIEAVKINDFVQYAHTMSLMCDLFFSFGGQNYARYLTFFSVFLANIDLSLPGAKELLKRGAFSVARSFIPGNRCPVDKTMEETFMRQAKSRGGAGGGSVGITGLLSNAQAYQRWVRTTHERSRYLQATLDMAGMSQSEEDGVKHRDLRPSEILNSEKAVTKAMAAVRSFVNPFSAEVANNLIILSSGASVSPDVQKDVLRAEQAGKAAKEEFIRERLEKRSLL